MPRTAAGKHSGLVHAALEYPKLQTDLPASSWHVQIAQGFCQRKLRESTRTAAISLLSLLGSCTLLQGSCRSAAHLSHVARFERGPVTDLLPAAAFVLVFSFSFLLPLAPLHVASLHC